MFYVRSMDRSAAADELPNSPPDEAAFVRAAVAEIARDMDVLSQLLQVGGAAMLAYGQCIDRGEVKDPAKGFERLSRAVRRTIALKMRLRQEQLAALRGQFRPPAAAPAPAAAAAAAAGAGKDAAAKPGVLVNLFADLHDRADDAEDGSEIGNTPSVEVYRSACADLGVTPDETAFTRGAAAAAEAAAEPAAEAKAKAKQAAPSAATAAALARVRAMVAAQGRPPGWAVRMGNGRDPPRPG